MGILSVSYTPVFFLFLVRFSKFPGWPQTHFVNTMSLHFDLPGRPPKYLRIFMGPVLEPFSPRLKSWTVLIFTLGLSAPWQG